MMHLEITRPKIIILIKRIGMQKIEELLLGVGQIWFDPIKKDIIMQISGKYTKSDYVIYEVDLEKYHNLMEDAKKEGLILHMRDK